MEVTALAETTFPHRGGRDAMRQNPRDVRKRRTLPEYLFQPEMEDLLRCAPHERARLFMLVQWRAGLRVSEAIALEWRDFRMGDDNPVVRVRRGKGYKPRDVPLHHELAVAIRMARDFDPSARQGGRIFDVSRSTASRWVQRAVARAVELGVFVPGRKISTHTLRHSFARHLVANRIPGNVVQLWLGHSRLSTTMRYMEIVPDPENRMETVP